MTDKVCRWVAKRLPKRLRYWVTMLAFAAVSKSKSVDAVSFREVMDPLE